MYILSPHINKFVVIRFYTMNVGQGLEFYYLVFTQTHTRFFRLRDMKNFLYELCY